MGLANKDKAKHTTYSKENLEKFETFRINLALLKSLSGKSAETLSKELGFEKGYRFFNLEYGRTGAPKLEEVMAIAKYFNITIDDLLYKRAKVEFK